MAENKKPFKFESWMLGALIIPIGIGISVINVMNKGTAALGASCSQNDDCSKGGQCVNIDGKSQCTHQCSPGSKSPEYICEQGFDCATISMRAGTKDVDINYCVVAEK